MCMSAPKNLATILTIGVAGFVLGRVSSCTSLSNAYSSALTHISYNSQEEVTSLLDALKNQGKFSYVTTYVMQEFERHPTYYREDLLSCTQLTYTTYPTDAILSGVPALTKKLGKYVIQGGWE